jgi:hypothetical protein
MTRRMNQALAALVVIGTLALAFGGRYPVLRVVTLGPMLDVLIVMTMLAAASRRKPRWQPRHAAR